MREPYGLMFLAEHLRLDDPAGSPTGLAHPVDSHLADRVAQLAGLREVASDRGQQPDLWSVVQPRAFVDGIAAYRQLARHRGRPAAVAGYGVGFFCALVVAEAIAFDEAARLAAIRGEACDDAAASTPGAMVRVRALEKDEVVRLADIRGVVACVEQDGAVLVSGPAEEVDDLERLLVASGGLTIREPCAGALYTDLMTPVCVRMARAAMGIDLSPPRVPVYLPDRGTVAASTDELRSCIGEEMLSAPIHSTFLEEVWSAIGELAIVAPNGKLHLEVRRPAAQGQQALRGDAVTEVWR